MYVTAAEWQSWSLSKPYLEYSATLSISGDVNTSPLVRIERGQKAKNPICGNKDVGYQELGVIYDRLLLAMTVRLARQPP
jgi:hypothetical protein